MNIRKHRGILLLFLWFFGVEGFNLPELVQLASGVRGRVINQEGNLILVRGSENPNIVQWVNANPKFLLSR
jgi:hypothetical protein